MHVWAAEERHTPAERAATADPVVIKLSFVMPWAVLPPIQLLFLYELPWGDVDSCGVARQELPRRHTDRVAAAGRKAGVRRRRR